MLVRRRLTTAPLIPPRVPRALAALHQPAVTNQPAALSQRPPTVIPQPLVPGPILPQPEERTTQNPERTGRIIPLPILIIPIQDQTRARTTTVPATVLPVATTRTGTRTKAALPVREPEITSRASRHIKKTARERIRIARITTMGAALIPEIIIQAAPT